MASDGSARGVAYGCGVIYHIAFAQDWERASRVGEYRVTTLGHTLDEVGFIHCGTGEQVAMVANSLYRGQRDLVLLAIDPDRVEHEIRYEDLDGQGVAFPHIYGPLHVDAVVAVSPLKPGTDGSFAPP